jgi:hypothetical protein
MRRRFVPLLLGLVIGLGLGVLLTWARYRVGWIGRATEPSHPRDHPVFTTSFFARFSPETTAARARPDVKWQVLWDHQRDTWLFDPDTPKVRRRGATVRYWVLRNWANDLLPAEQLEALNERLHQAIVEGVVTEGAEIFDSSAKWASSNEMVLQPPGPDAKPLFRPFIGSQVCYRTGKVEGRVFASITGEAGSVTICLTLIEQPTAPFLDRMG